MDCRKAIDALGCECKRLTEELEKSYSIETKLRERIDELEGLGYANLSTELLETRIKEMSRELSKRREKDPIMVLKEWKDKNRYRVLIYTISRVQDGFSGVAFAIDEFQRMAIAEDVQMLMFCPLELSNATPLCGGPKAKRCKATKMMLKRNLSSDLLEQIRDFDDVEYVFRE